MTVQSPQRLLEGSGTKGQGKNSEGAAPSADDARRKAEAVALWLLGPREGFGKTARVGNPFALLSRYPR
jgi:hypothetical protein